MNVPKIEVVTLEVDRLQRMLDTSAERAVQRIAPADPSAWTVKECAAYLQVSTDVVYQMANAGEIPAFRVGEKGWRFHPAKVREWEGSSGKTAGDKAMEVELLGRKNRKK